MLAAWIALVVDEFCGANSKESMNENECVQESLFFSISFKIHVVIYIYLYVQVIKMSEKKHTILHTHTLASHVHNTKRIKKQFRFVCETSNRFQSSKWNFGRPERVCLRFCQKSSRNLFSNSNWVLSFSIWEFIISFRFICSSLFFLRTIAVIILYRGQNLTSISQSVNHRKWFSFHK